MHLPTISFTLVLQTNYQMVPLVSRATMQLPCNTEEKRIETATMTTSLAFEQNMQSTSLIYHRLPSHQAHRCLENVPSKKKKIG